MPALRWLLAAILFCPSPAVAVKLRLCVDVHPHPPYITADGGGSVGDAVAVAAREAGFELEFYKASIARCRAELELNLVHGFPITPYSPDLAAIAAYPMRDGGADPARATMRARILLYRRSGAGVTWDGARIGGLERPVLIVSGSVLIPRYLSALGAPFDKNGQSMEVNFAKLLVRRGDALAGFEEEGERLLRDPRFAGKIEALPLPLFEQVYYLAISKDFRARNGPAVEAMWDAIGRLNQAAKSQKK